MSRLKTVRTTPGGVASALGVTACSTSCSACRIASCTRSGVAASVAAPCPIAACVTARVTSSVASGRGLTPAVQVTSCFASAISTQRSVIPAITTIRGVGVRLSGRSASPAASVVVVALCNGTLCQVTGSVRPCSVGSCRNTSPDFAST